MKSLFLVPGYHSKTITTLHTQTSPFPSANSLLIRVSLRDDQYNCCSSIWDVHGPFRNINFDALESVMGTWVRKSCCEGWEKRRNGFVPVSFRRRDVSAARNARSRTLSLSVQLPIHLCFALQTSIRFPDPRL